MREGARPLLCELHAHTTWSDGELSLAGVVDLYGSAGFDVRCVTDHVLRSDDPWPLRNGRPCVDATNVRLPRRDRARARSRALGLPTPARARLRAHVQRPEPGQGRSRRRGRAAQPRRDRRRAGSGDGAGARRGRRDSRRAPARLRPTPAVPFPTCYFARRWRELRGLFDRVELFNGRQLFSWVAEAGLPAVACGDLHRAEQLPAGRRSFRASTTKRRSSTTCPRPGPCS
jgi:hypothetical protein